MSDIDQIDFEFRGEKPKNDGDLLFGHHDIVQTLSTIITKNKSHESFTIGLYGDWGSGKSSIAESLQTKLKDDKIPLIIFDVWKHEGDALRRTFLKSLFDDLKNKKNLDKSYINSGFFLNTRLNDIVQITKKYYELIWANVWNHVKILGLFLIIIIIPFLIIYWGVNSFFSGPEYSDPINIFFKGLVSAVPPVMMFKYFNQFIDVTSKTTVQDKFKDPHEFEDEFRRLIKYGLSSRKLVIVFDNLDRVSGEKAVEIITTIKTFLEPIDKELTKKSITFIIPCDDKAIKRHLKKSLGYGKYKEGFNKYADEYLRKFFNTIIWIPEFYETELEDHAYNELQKTKIPAFNDLILAGLIVKVFDQNPRQITQFVNILLSNYLLMKKREENLSGFNIDSNVSQLAKFLLLKQRFPDILDNYRQALCFNLEEDIFSDAEKSAKFEIEQDRVIKFRSFQRLTNFIRIENLDLFFKFRLTKFEEQFENSAKLIKLIESNEIELIINSEINSKEESKLVDNKAYLDTLDLENKIVGFSNIVKEKIQKNIYPVYVIQFIDSVFHLTKKYELKLNTETYRVIYQKLEEFKDYVNILKISNLVSEGFRKVDDPYIKGKIKSLLSKVLSEDFVQTNKSEEI